MGEEKVFRPQGDPINGIPNSKSGTVWTASMHVFCAVVGAGILNLPASVSWLGYVAGPICIVIFYLISLASARMLASIYEVNGIEHDRYHHAVAHILSRREAFFVSLFQLLNIFLTTLAYTITGAGSLVEIVQKGCESYGVDVESAGCFSISTGGQWKMTLIFGGIELLLSQVKSLEEAWWVSSLGTLASFIYAFIALILSCVNLSGSPKQPASIGGRSGTSTADKLFGIFNSLGSIAFAYNFMLILLEIQDTLRQPPRAEKAMKRASNIAITVSFLFYFLVAVTGYIAEGNEVQAMILESFDGPNWVLILAQCAVFLHMLTAFQVYGQAMFNTVESWLKWWLLQRQIKKEAAAAAAAHAPGADAAAASTAMPTPFDAEHAHHDHAHKPLLGLDHVKLAPIDERMSSAVSGARITQARSSVLTHRRTASLDVHTGLEHRPSLRSMYGASTGFTNEEVPMNEEGVLLPFYWRILTRSSYVLIITLLASIMPFFGAFAGLVGAVTFWPLAIYNPYAMYRKVYPDRISPAVSLLMWVIWWAVLIVSVAATVGSMRNIVVGFSDFTLFQ